MSALSAYQRRMAAVVAGGDADALAADAAEPGVTWRAAVYRNTFAAGCRDALAANHPAVEAIVGAEFFSALAQAYIAAHPPTGRTLVGYGQSFPAFLRAFPPVARVPYLPDAADLDRAWLAAHVAPDAPPLTGADAMRLAQASDLAAQRLALHPSAQIVTTEWRLYPLWAAARDTTEPDDAALRLQRTGDTVLIWRPGHEVRHRRLATAEAAFLGDIAAGATLGAAAECAAAADPGAGLAELFATVLQDGVLADPAEIPHQDGEDAAS